MKEADVDCMGVEDIACMMMQNCTDAALKAKLGAEKTPILENFNLIIESHEAGKISRLILVVGSVLMQS